MAAELKIRFFHVDDFLKTDRIKGYTTGISVSYSLKSFYCEFILLLYRRNIKNQINEIIFSRFTTATTN